MPERDAWSVSSTREYRPASSWGEIVEDLVNGEPLARIVGHSFAEFLEVEGVLALDAAVLDDHPVGHLGANPIASNSLGEPV